MARIFKYGKLRRVNNVPGINHLPGTYFNAQGVQYGQGAVNTVPADTIEFGEIVEIVSENNKSLTVKRATSNIAVGIAGIVLRDITGITGLREGVSEGYEMPHVPLTVVKCAAPGTWDVVVPLAASQSIVAGTIPRVGTGEGTTVAGAIYAAAVTTNTKELTGFTFKGAKFKPTLGNSEAVLIGKA